MDESRTPSGEKSNGESLSLVKTMSATCLRSTGNPQSPTQRTAAEGTKTVARRYTTISQADDISCVL